MTPRAIRDGFLEAVDRRPLDTYLAVQSWWWGLWALSPWDAFGVIPGAYTVLALLPEWAWGAVFTAHGVGHLAAVVRGDDASCRRAALSLQYLWAIVFFNYLVTIPLSLATPTYGMLFVGSLWVHGRHCRRVV
ncbi:MAG: hypothetical protein OEW52_00105 [Thermoleophilia bacterium]|nr:hypothetical protein [Thermoleophilia bacterium]